MENLPTDEVRPEGLEEAIAEFTTVLAKAEAARLAENASKQFLREFCRELSAERQMKLMLKALVICMHSYANNDRIEPKLELLLREWWGNEAFQELWEVLQLLPGSADSRGAMRDKQKTQLPVLQLWGRRRKQVEFHTVVVARPPKGLKKVLFSSLWLGTLVSLCIAVSMTAGVLPFTDRVFPRFFCGEVKDERVSFADRK